MRVGEAEAKPPQPEPVQSVLGEDEERVSRARIGGAIEPLLMQLVWLMLAFSIGGLAVVCRIRASERASRGAVRKRGADCWGGVRVRRDLMLKSRCRCSIVGRSRCSFTPLFGVRDRTFSCGKTATKRWMNQRHDHRWWGRVWICWSSRPCDVEPRVWRR